MNRVDTASPEGDRPSARLPVGAADVVRKEDGRGKLRGARVPHGCAQRARGPPPALRKQAHRMRLRRYPTQTGLRVAFNTARGRRRGRGSSESK